MDISPRKPLKRSAEPVDDWLHNEGYVRKRSPKDPTCLFRAVSEQIYLTQYYHLRVRRECVEFMRKNRKFFEEYVSIPLENYLEQMSCFTEWGGSTEIQAMSLLYERDFVIFNGLNMVIREATNNGFKNKINLCHTPQKQYESVFSRDFIPTAAFCQSLVYQILYKDVFKMSDIDDTVQKMLHDRSNNFRHDKFFLKANLEIREQLTTELLSKIEKGCENSEEAQTVTKGLTPFPYRVAKALDPNIYRNTDFDIWHEIRREVRNAGWSRWNSSELQIGGRCLVQVNFKENDLNQNSKNILQISNVDNEKNGNTSKRGKREQPFWNGHIQEMSKDEGPVVVYIEELGEKRTLPFAALKPFSARKSKQNWNVTTPRKNSSYESNHKWKRSWNPSVRKLKDSAWNSTGVTNNNIDRNNNNGKLDIDDKTNDNGNNERWDHESDQTKTSSLKNYTMDTYNSCQGFPVENTIDVRPVTVVLDNAQPAMTPGIQQNTEDYNRNSTKTDKKNSGNESVDRGSPSSRSIAPDSIIQPLQQVSLHASSEPFYQPHPAVPPMFPVNPNMICGSPDGNPYPPFPYFAGEPPAPGSLLDRTIRAINFTVPSSIDANGSDLPYADPVTLRFFFNLGLEYFRSSHVWGYGPIGQPVALGPNFGPQAGLLPLPPPSQPGDGIQPAISNEDEGSRGINGMRQNYVPGRRRGDHQSNAGRMNSGQQQSTKSYNNRRNDSHDSHGSRNEASKQPGESYKPPPHLNNDRTKDQSNMRRNGPSSRYKKNNDARNWNVNNSLHTYQQDQQQPPVMYQSNTGNMEPPVLQGIKTEPGQQATVAVPQGLQPQSQSPASSINSGNFSPSYGPPTVYTAMPYFGPEGETYYAPGPGFYPFPIVAHQDVGDANNVNSYPAPVFQSGAENYGHPIPAVYPPYMYPPQAIYPGLPPQNSQDNWYGVSGQPQLVHYPPMPPTHSGPTANGSPNP